MPSHADNLKNNFLVLGEGPTFEINGSLVHQKKSLVLILVKKTQNLVWVCIIMLIIVIFMLMENKSLSLKPTVKMLAFQLGFASQADLMDLVQLSLKKYL